MRKVLVISALAASLLPALPVSASPIVKKYTVEKGVKVYRSTRSPEMQARYLARKQQARRAYKLQQRREALRALAEARQNAYERGFERGFIKAQKQAKKAHKHKRSCRHHNCRNRYNYGRRYTTSFYHYRPAYGLGGISYYRPAYVVSRYHR